MLTRGVPSFSIGKREATAETTAENTTIDLEKQPSALYDLDKLAAAIASHETAMGTTGVGKTQNNVCGIRRNGAFESYKTIEDGLADCKSVLTKYYADKTISQIAQRWTTTQRQEWIDNVTYFYNN